jgi:hypothetical protein
METDIDLAYENDITPEDRIVLDSLGGFLSDGMAMKAWWDDAYTSDRFDERFDLVHTLHRSEKSFGVFGRVALDRGPFPIMGVQDEVFYDRPKGQGKATAESSAWMCEQVKEFVLHYFMRISDFRMPQQIVASESDPSPAFLKRFSMKPKEEIERKGMGFTQKYYKRSDTGQIGKFPEEGASEILDLREIGSTYDWVVVKLRVFDFCVTMKPLGADLPRVTMPLKEESYLVITPGFITNIDNPDPGVLGEYGFGYAFVKNPVRGPFAYGPGEFEAAFQTINFKVMDTGETRVFMTFVSDQPEKIMNLKIDPVNWSFALADMMSFGMTSRVFKPIKELLTEMPFKAENVDPTIPALNFLNSVTGGQAGENLGLQKETLYKGFLTQHSMQHYQTLLGSLRTWRQIPDWLDKEGLPAWVISGESS